jgi:folate-binding protein YgfZ
MTKTKIAALASHAIGRRDEEAEPPRYLLHRAIIFRRSWLDKGPLAKPVDRPQISIMSGPSFSLVPHRGVIAVGGPDRVDFLQGLISNDTTKVAPGRAIWAALLTAQGRFLNDMFVADGGNDTLLLETERARAPALAKKLGLYKLRSKVTVEDRSTAMDVAVVFGPGAETVLPLAGGVAFVDPRLPELGVRLLAPASQATALLAVRGVVAAPIEAYDALRLRLGVPDGSRDLVVDKALLLENGFDELNGVDWQKGCYMGQELTARTKYRALIRKRLFPVRIEGALPEPGTAIFKNGQEVGELRSGSGSRALAMLRLDAVQAGQELKAGETGVVPEIPDWMRLPETTAP